MKPKPSDRNYLYIVVGGLFIIAALVLAVFAMLPMQGCVGVVEINGEIVSEDVESSVFVGGTKGAQTIAEEIGSAGERDDVKSLLVLIDSPGGGVVASGELYSALSSLEKPKVSYIHEVGASGGYFAAVATDYIIANPDAITGSIGARATFSDLSGLFEKLGYNQTTIATGEMKNIGGPDHPLTQEEYALLEGIVNESFVQFKAAVLKGREGRIDLSRQGEIFDGRIMTGRRALSYGLVDGTGSKKDAIAKAGELAGIQGEPRICMISAAEDRQGLFGSLASSTAKAMIGWVGANPLLSYR